MSRSGAKETTLDYDRDLAQRQFAERRGIAEVLRVSSEIDLAGSENLGQKLQAPQKQRRSMFDGLKLKSSSASSRATVPEKSRTQDRLLELARPLSAFEQAVDRYARAYCSADRHLQENLPVLETQKQELFAAARQLDQSRPGAHDLIRSALQYDPKMSEAMTQLSGRARLGQLIAGMDREQAALTDPNVRADRFIERWQELKAERQQLRGWSQDEARGKVETLMRGIAKDLERDPQLETVLRNRAQELGISRIRKEQNIAHEMERQVTKSPGLGLGLGLER